MSRSQGIIAALGVVIAILALALAYLVGRGAAGPAPPAAATGRPPASPAPRPPAPPAKADAPDTRGPQIGDVLDETRWNGERPVFEKGWEWAGSGLYNGQRDHVVRFRRGRNIMLVLVDPVTRGPTGGVHTARVTQTYTVALAPGEAEMDDCSMNGESIPLGIRNAGGDRYAGVTSDGAHFQATAWLPLSAFDYCELVGD